MNKLSFFLFFFCGISVSAQDGTFFEWEEDLYQIDNQKRLLKVMDRIDELDSYQFNDIAKVNFELAEERQWGCMLAKRLGWEQVVHQETEDLTAYFYSEDMSLMTGKDVKEMFGFSGPPIKVDPMNISHYSNERFEDCFVLKAKNEPYAVVVLVHSYANGNMTSWFKETRYYFVLE